MNATALQSSPWRPYVAAVDTEIRSQLHFQSIVVVPSGDHELCGFLRECNPDWLPSIFENIALPTWCSLAATVLGEAETAKLASKLDQPETYSALLKLRLRESPRLHGAQCVFLAVVPGRQLGDFARDLRHLGTLLANRRIKPRAVLFCNDHDRFELPDDAGVVWLSAHARHFRRSVAQLFCDRVVPSLGRGGRPTTQTAVDECDCGRYGNALVGGISGLANLSISDAEQCIAMSEQTREALEGRYRSERGDESRVAPLLESDERQRELFQACVLFLLQMRLPRLFGEARFRGLLNEVIYGLQRASLTSGSADADGLGAIEGEMPSGYSEALGDLPLLRWLKALLAPAPFTGTELVRFVENRDEADSFHVRLSDLRSRLVEKPGHEESESGDLDSHSAVAQGIAELLLASAGFDANAVDAQMRGLSTLGSRVDLDMLERVRKVSEWIVAALPGPGEVRRTRDFRRCLLLMFLARQIESTLHTRLTKVATATRARIEGLEKDLRDLSSSEASPRLRKRSQLIRKLWLGPAVSSSDRSGQTSTTDDDADIGRFRKHSNEFAIEALRKREDRIRECLDAIARLPLAVSRNSTPGRFREAAQGGSSAQEFIGERFLDYLNERSSHTAWQLDLHVEKMRYQWFLLTRDWVQAKRILDEFRKLRKGRAELSEGEVHLFEAAFLESQGQLMAARTRYEAIRNNIDSSIDPVLWSRAHYAYIRTDLRLRGKPEVAAITGAMAILDLESQRRADYSIGAEERRVFPSFRGSVRPFVARLEAELGSRSPSPGDWLFEIDAQRMDHEDFDPMIHLRLLTSRAVIVFLSADYFDSPWCIYELHTALHLARFENRKLGWLFLNSDASEEELRDPQRYVRGRLMSSIEPAIDSNPLYRTERLDRLFELGQIIGSGIYTVAESARDAHGDSALAAAIIEFLDADVRP